MCCIIINILPTSVWFNTMYTIWKALAAQCDCPSEIPNAEIHYTELQSGDKARYTCVAGYSSLDNYIDRVCQDDGYWSTEPFECRG